MNVLNVTWDEFTAVYDLQREAMAAALPCWWRRLEYGEETPRPAPGAADELTWELGLARLFGWDVIDQLKGSETKLRAHDSVVGLPRVQSEGVDDKPAPRLCQDPGTLRLEYLAWRSAHGFEPTGEQVALLGRLQAIADELCPHLPLSGCYAGFELG